MINCSSSSSIRSPIGSLFLSCSASTIPRSVASRIINSVKRVFITWARAHCLVEGGEIMSPLLCKTNTSASIVAVGSVLRVLTSILRHLPSSIFRRVGHAMSASTKSNFPAQTTTTLDQASLEIARSNLYKTAASTASKPESIVVLGAYSIQNGQPSYMLPSPVFHAGIIHQDRQFI